MNMKDETRRPAQPELDNEIAYISLIWDIWHQNCIYKDRIARLQIASQDLQLDTLSNTEHVWSLHMTITFCLQNRITCTLDWKSKTHDLQNSTGPILMALHPIAKCSVSAVQVIANEPANTLWPCGKGTPTWPISTKPVTSSTSSYSIFWLGICSTGALSRNI
jgi:hypothetical protein